MPDLDFYNWRKTFSFDARLNLIITSRGRGKTYGLRKQCVKDYIDGKWRFVEIVRYDAEISDVCAGYFDKLQLNGEYPGYIFRCEGGGKTGRFYMAREPEKDKGAKWELIGYCVSLNSQQKKKRKTFAHVKRVFFDEFILEKRTFPGYLPGEYSKFVNLIDSIAREIPGEPTPVRIYLCGNACDLINPYFVEFGIKEAPRAGYTWIERGRVLLHYEQSSAYVEAKRETLVGWLSRGHLEDMITNEFSNAGSEFIEKKSKDAKFLFAFKYAGKTYGVWISYNRGFYYITSKIPNDAREIYALTREDNAPNLLMAKRANHKMQTLIDMYYSNCVRYDNPGTREGFLQMASLFGVR